jgi:dUTP pyrophosphatase
MVKLKIMKTNPFAVIPKYANPGDAGMDLYAVSYHILEPGDICLVPIGIKVEFPVGYELQIRPRSGLALKYGISVVNTPGTVDAGYRGEIGVILINHGKEQFRIERGDRIAQAVLKKVERADIKEVTELSETKRGEGGYGSSGA